MMKLKIAILLLIVMVTGCNPQTSVERNAVSMFVSCDTNGWIVPCGCSAGQSGGLIKRASLIEELGGSDDVLVLDVGGAASGVSQYHQMKLQAILQGEIQMGLSAHNIGRSEAALGPKAIKELQQETSVPFVSANVTDSTGDFVVPRYRIIDAGGQKIAIIGLLDPDFGNGEIQVLDPKQSVLEVVGLIGEQADVHIVLAYLQEDALNDLAGQLPEIDAIFGGPTGQSMKPAKPAATWLASTTNKGKFLIHFRLDPTQPKPWSGQIVEVSDQYEDDSQQIANLENFYVALGDADLLATDTGLERQLTHRTIQARKFSGNQNCQTCHVQDCSHWSTTKHAHAWETLLKKEAHVDPYCQQCHATGYGQPGGFLSIAKSQELVNVGCESCHGPSGAHAQNPKARTGFVAVDSCVRCHDRENSPAFDFQKYWQTIQHGAKVKLSDLGLNQSSDSEKEQ